MSTQISTKDLAISLAASFWRGRLVSSINNTEALEAMITTAAYRQEYRFLAEAGQLLAQNLNF